MTNNIICGNNAQVLAGFPADYIDLTVTSPPYDDMDLDYNPIPKDGLRTYNGYEWDFKAIAQELYRVTKPGGVVVWVVNDPTINGSESLASSLQKIYFRLLGFNVHDTMIWSKLGFTSIGDLQFRYAQIFEFNLVLSKGLPKAFNPIIDRTNKISKGHFSKRMRLPNGDIKDPGYFGKRREKGYRFNIWDITPHIQNGDDVHPAPFPEALARDHIISWSNPGDLILDPFCGSGTTLKMAKEQGRNYIGIDISPEYCALSQRRVEGAKVPLFVMQPETNGKPKPEQLELLPE